MVAASETRDAPDYEKDFLRILQNMSKFGPGDTPARKRGFVVLVRGGNNLKPLQDLCFADGVKTRNPCLTARYRLNPTAGMGTLLFGFLSDLYQMRSRTREPDTEEAHTDVIKLAGAFSPAPESDSWRNLTNFYLGNVLEFEQGFSEGLRDGKTQGVLQKEQLTSLLAKFDDESSVLRSGQRLVLFGEISGEATNFDEWTSALVSLLNQLPERVGVVLLAPKDLTLRLSDPDPHFLELTVPEGGEAAAFANVAYKYLDSSFHSDVPAEKDELDVNRYADAIARFVLHPQTKSPLTIGIHGPWGKGKSSFMRLIDSALIKHAESNSEKRTQAWSDLVRNISAAEAILYTDSQIDEKEKEQRAKQIDLDKDKAGALFTEMAQAAKQNVLSVIFNAWQFEDAKQTWAGLASVISEEMEKVLPPHTRQWLSIKYAWKERKTEMILNVLLPLSVGCVVTGLFFAGLIGSGTVPKPVSALGLAGSIFLTIWTVSSQFLKVAEPISARVLSYIRLPSYREQMGFQHRVIDDLNFVYEFVATRIRTDAFSEVRNFRVVVYIDDLDRCSENKIMEILQAINLILAECKFFVFVGMDTDMIYRAIKSYYKENLPDRFADSYLSKVIQISFHLPESKTNTRSGYLGTLFSLAARLELRSRAAQNGSPADPVPVDAGPAGGEALPYDLKDILEIVPVQLKEAEDTADELQAFTEYCDFIDDNPREIKRLINIHRLIKILLRKDNTSWSTGQQKKLVKWLIFCDTWPHLVGSILESTRNSKSANCLLDLAIAMEDDVEKQKTTDGPQFDRLREFAEFLPSNGQKQDLSLEEKKAEIMMHALSASEIDDDFRSAAKFSQMVRKPPTKRTAPKK